MSSPRQIRVIRGAASAAVATFVALLSHIAAGGSLPAVLGIVVPFVLSLAVCVMLAGRRLSLTRLSLSVAVSQLLFHTLFVLGTPGAGSGSAAPTAAHAAHGAGMLLLSAAPTGASETLLHAGPAMWAGHAVAAAVTIAALYRGERALRALSAGASHLVAWFRGRVQLTTALPRPVIAARVPAPVGSERPARLSCTLSDTPRRGPPLLLAA